MNIKKVSTLVAAGALAAVLALAGCSSSSSSSAAASSASVSGESASAASESASAASESASAAAESTSAAAASASAAAADEGEIALLEDGKLIVGTSPDYPPFENLEGDEYVGLDIEIAKAIADKLGLEVEFKALQFDAIIPAVAAGGQVDMGISGFTVDPDRAKEIDFTSSYYVDDLAIAIMSEGDINADNAEDQFASGEVKIAVQSGTSGEVYVNETYGDGVAVAYGNSNDAFAAMQSGQAQAVCTNAAVVEKMLETAYPDAEIVKSIATGEEYAIVVSQDNPALTAAINDALAELTADGIIDSLITEYLG